MRTVILIVILTLTAPVPAGAQSWLNKLKDSVGSAVGGVTGKEGSGGTAALSTGDIVAGLREALKVGSGRVVTQLAAADGYNADPSIHIPLPPELAKVQSMLKQFGLSGLADDVELKLNRAAEAAAPGTKDIFWKAIEGMTLDDARGIYEGADDAATRYFESVSSGDLTALIKPIVDRTPGRGRRHCRLRPPDGGLHQTAAGARRQNPTLGPRYRQGPRGPLPLPGPRGGRDPQEPGQTHHRDPHPRLWRLAPYPD